MVKTCSSDVGAWRLMPGWGASVPHVVGCGQKFKNKNKIKFMYQRIIEEEGERHAAEWREEEEEKKRYKETFFSDNFHMGVYFYTANLRSQEESKMDWQKSDQVPHPE